jgi:hypothetical protein
VEHPRALGGALRGGRGCLRLLIEADQEPWSPELDGQVRVSSLQAGVFAGPLGSGIGQHRCFNPAAVVREAQQNVRLYTLPLRPLRAALQGDGGIRAAWSRCG